jgi:subtilisin-like proprotein convertase family protein
MTTRTRTKLLLAACAVAIVALALPATGSAKTKTVTTKTSLTFTGTGPNVLPAMGSATSYPWNVVAFALAGKTTGVEITLNGLTHERVSDLEALLVAPNGGRNVLFMSDVGDDTDIPPPGINVTFKDGANTNAPIGVPLVPGNFRPTNGFGTDPDAFAPPAPAPSYGTSMARLKGQNPNGLWSLYLTDDNGDPLDPGTGSVASFALKINSQLKTKVKTKKRKPRGCKRFKSKKKRKKCQRKRKRR